MVVVGRAAGGRWVITVVSYQEDYRTNKALIQLLAAPELTLPMRPSFKFQRSKKAIFVVSLLPVTGLFTYKCQWPEQSFSAISVALKNIAEKPMN